MSSIRKPAISTSITLNQTMSMQFFADFRTLYSLENTLPSKLWPKQFLITYSGKKLQRYHCQKKLPSLLSSEQHFAGIFASEPMTLLEIDHVSFLVEHVQTFFAVESWPDVKFCAHAQCVLPRWWLQPSLYYPSCPVRRSCSGRGHASSSPND